MVSDLAVLWMVAMVLLHGPVGSCGDALQDDDANEAAHCVELSTLDDTIIESGVKSLSEDCLRFAPVRSQLSTSTSAAADALTDADAAAAHSYPPCPVQVDCSLGGMALPGHLCERGFYCSCSLKTMLRCPEAGWLPWEVKQRKFNGYFCALTFTCREG